jgi:membrane-associated phospholipid phosphatase
LHLDDVRVEDVLAVGVGAGLAGFVGVRAALGQIPGIEDDFWQLLFVLAPAAVLTFAASARFALRLESGGKATASSVFGVVRDWFPFAFFLFSYQLLRLSVFPSVLPGDRDKWLLAIDRSLFGETPAVFLERFIRPALTDVLVGAYSLHLVLPPALAIWLYQVDRKLFRFFLLTIMVIGVLGTIGYAAVPGIGPKSAFPELFHRELDGGLYIPVDEALEMVRFPRDVFPSLHAGISSLVLFFAYRRRRAVGHALLLPVTLNWISTIYLRYHYAIDVVAGWVAAALAILIAWSLLRLEGAFRARRRPP